MRKMKTTLLLLAFILLPTLLHAQEDPGFPCDDQDPFDNNCPLDSWLYFVVLAPLAITLAALYFRGEAIKKMKDEREDLFIEEHYFAPTDDQDIAA